MNKAVCFSKIRKFPKIFEFLYSTQLCSEFLSKQNGVTTFFNFFNPLMCMDEISRYLKIFENSKSVTCKTIPGKTKPMSVKPPNKSKSSTWEIKIREKKVTLLTRERANFTRSATLTFKRLSAKTKNFFNLFGNFFEALTIFSPIFFVK